ncbi:MAG: hypothetical protein ACLU0O_05560 [Collinsella sp.]
MAVLARWRSNLMGSVVRACSTPGCAYAQAIADAKTGYVMQLEPRKHKLVMDLATLIGAHYARRWFLPTPLRAVCLSWPVTWHFCALPFMSWRSRRLTVPVLDASAIGISFVKRDVDTAGRRCSCSTWASCSRTTPAP